MSRRTFGNFPIQEKLNRNNTIRKQETPTSLAPIPENVWEKRGKQTTPVQNNDTVHIPDHQRKAIEEMNKHEHNKATSEKKVVYTDGTNNLNNLKKRVTNLEGKLSQVQNNVWTNIKERAEMQFEALKNAWSNLMDSDKYNDIPDPVIQDTDQNKKQLEKMHNLNRNLLHDVDLKNQGLKMMKWWLDKHWKYQLPVFLNLKINGKFCDWIVNSPKYQHWACHWILDENSIRLLKSAQSEYEEAKKHSKPRDWKNKQNREFFRPPKSFDNVPLEQQDRIKAAWKRAVMYGSLHKKDEHLVIDKDEQGQTVIWGTPGYRSDVCNPYILHLDF